MHVDVDECADGTDSCFREHGGCINTDDGYQCFCDPGYEGDGITCKGIA